MGLLDNIDEYFEQHYSMDPGQFVANAKALMLDFARKFAQYWAADNGKVYREINHDLKVFYDEYFKTLDKTNGEQTGDTAEEA